MELRKFFYERCIVLEKTLIQFVCTYLDRWPCYSVFTKILLIVISRRLLHGIAQNLIWNIRVAIYDIDLISVIIPQKGALQLHSFENSCDSIQLHEIALNLICDILIKALHSGSLCTNSSLRGAAMRLWIHFH